MNPLQIYEGSNGTATKALYARLETMGPAGIIAMNLFRACKCSARAKVYRGRGYKDEAYGRKRWSMDNLCRELEKSAEALGIKWGWKEDPQQPIYSWVLYVDTPRGQVSFHSDERLHKQDYDGEWDRDTHSAARIIRWTTDLLEKESACDITFPLTEADAPCKTSALS